MLRNRLPCSSAVGKSMKEDDCRCVLPRSGKFGLLKRSCLHPRRLALEWLGVIDGNVDCHFWEVSQNEAKFIFKIYTQKLKWALWKLFYLNQESGKEVMRMALSAFLVTRCPQLNTAVPWPFLSSFSHWTVMSTLRNIWVLHHHPVSGLLFKPILKRIKCP